MEFNKLFEYIDDSLNNNIDGNETDPTTEEIEYNGYTIKHFPMHWTFANREVFDTDGYIILSKYSIGSKENKSYLPLYCENVKGEVINFNTLDEAKEYIDQWLNTNKVDFKIKLGDEIHSVIKDEYKPDDEE